MAGDVPPAAAVALAGVGRQFRTSTGVVDALVDVDADIRPGRLTVVAGPSGSGKSTFLALVGCLDRPTAGTVWIDGVDVGSLSRGERRRRRRTEIGFVLPMPAENLLVDRSADDNLAWACRLRGSADDAEWSTNGFSRAGLAERRSARGVELSGGEQQRLALICAFAGEPRGGVVDEPTASLDADSGHAIAGLLADLVRGGGDRAGATAVVASHDPAVIDVADEVIQLDHGRRVR